MSRRGTADHFGLEPVPNTDRAKVENTKRIDHTSIHSISWRWPILVLMVGCLAYYIVHLLDHHLPTVVTVEEAKNNIKLFSGERSAIFLKKLTDIGPRLTGTPQNEVMAVNVITSELKDAQLKAHSSQSLLYEIQQGSGAYTLEYKPRFTNVYDNIKNVVAMIEGSNKTHSILVNCHFDSMPGSPGASDDGISCAVMIELIRIISQSDVRLKHNVIFLFNGAEETSLQGSHLFLQHRWASTARVFLNIEAAGLGGRAILFQSGPHHAWLLNYYAKYAPHPHAVILGEELFQSGVIPSDSDFRIFRDFGNMPGMDFAFSRNGFVYHTRYDSLEYLPVGSHQHMGDNGLALLRALGNAPEVENVKEHYNGQVVYFDYIGWFMVSYTHTSGTVINIFIFLLYFVSVVVFTGRLSQWKWLPQSWGWLGRKLQPIEKAWNKKVYSNKKEDSFYGQVGSINNTDTVFTINNGDGDPQNADGGKKDTKMEEIKDNVRSKFVTHPWLAWVEIGFSALGHLIGIGFGVVVNMAIGAFIDGVAVLAMPWYSNVWLVFPLFWCPCLTGYGLVLLLVDKWRKKKCNLSASMTTQLNLVASQIPWALLLFVTTCLGVRSAVAIALPLLFSALANLIIHLTPLYLTVHKWVWVYLFVHIPSIIFQMYIILLMYTTLLPIMGRSGTINADLFMALVSSAMAMYFINFAISFLSLVRRSYMALGFLAAFVLVMLPVSLCTSVGQPYSAGPSNPAPQRYWIMHSDRQFYDENNVLRRQETGYFVLNLDRNSPRTIPLRGRSLYSLEEDCDNELYCGLPLYVGRMVPLSRKSSWIQADPPKFPFPTELIVQKRLCIPSPTQCTLDLLLKGPSRLTVTLSPREGVSVDTWSLPTEPVAAAEWKGRPTYFIHIVTTETDQDYPLSITFNVTSNLTGPLVDLGLAGNYINSESSRTIQFSEFLNDFPDWTFIIGWISSYKGYVL